MLLQFGRIWFWADLIGTVIFVCPCLFSSSLLAFFFFFLSFFIAQYSWLAWSTWAKKWRFMPLPRPSVPTCYPNSNALPTVFFPTVLFQRYFSNDIVPTVSSQRCCSNGNVPTVFQRVCVPLFCGWVGFTCFGPLFLLAYSATPGLP